MAGKLIRHEKQIWRKSGCVVGFRNESNGFVELFTAIAALTTDSFASKAFRVDTDEGCEWVFACGRGRMAVLMTMLVLRMTGQRFGSDLETRAQPAHVCTSNDALHVSSLQDPIPRRASYYGARVPGKAGRFPSVAGHRTHLRASLVVLVWINDDSEMLLCVVIVLVEMAKDLTVRRRNTGASIASDANRRWTHDGRNACFAKWCSDLCWHRPQTLCCRSKRDVRRPCCTHDCLAFVERLCNLVGRG